MAWPLPAVSASRQPWHTKSVAISTPFEVSESPAGNYLAARVAESKHDTFAASTSSARACARTLRNIELVQRAFVAAPRQWRHAGQFGPGAGRAVAARALLGAAGAGAVRDLKAKSGPQPTEHRRHRPPSAPTVLLTAAGVCHSAIVKRRGPRSTILCRVPRLSRRVDARAAGQLDKAASGSAAYNSKTRRPASRQLLRPQPFPPGQDRGSQGHSRRFRKNPAPQCHRPPRGTRRGQKAGEPVIRDVSGKRHGSPLRPRGLWPRQYQQPAGRRCTTMVFLRLALGARVRPMPTGAGYGSGRARYEAAIEVYDQTPEADEPDASPTPTSTSPCCLTPWANPKSPPTEIVHGTSEGRGTLSALRPRAQGSATLYARVLALDLAAAKRRHGDLCSTASITKHGERWEPFKKARRSLPRTAGHINYLGTPTVSPTSRPSTKPSLRRQLSPEDSYIVDSLGWAPYKLRRERSGEASGARHRTQARRSRDRSRRRLLESWPPARHRFQWNHARDLNPEKDDLPKMFGKIDKGIDQTPSQPAVVRRWKGMRRPRTAADLSLPSALITSAVAFADASARLSIARPLAVPSTPDPRGGRRPPRVHHHARARCARPCMRQDM